MEGSLTARRIGKTIDDLENLVGSAATPVRVGALVFGFCFLVVLLGLLYIRMNIPG